MARKTYQKLIRDRVPEIIKATNGKPSYTVLDEEGFRKALKKKLVEEATEVLHADTKQELISELGDVLEVIEAIPKAFGLSSEEIKTYQKAKKKERGGFDKKLFLAYVDRP